jgi:hypothetical protein
LPARHAQRAVPNPPCPVAQPEGSSAGAALLRGQGPGFPGALRRREDADVQELLALRTQARALELAERAMHRLLTVVSESEHEVGSAALLVAPRLPPAAVRAEPAVAALVAGKLPATALAGRLIVASISFSADSSPLQSVFRAFLPTRASCPRDHRRWGRSPPLWVTGGVAAVAYRLWAWRRRLQLSLVLSDL